LRHGSTAPPRPSRRSPSSQAAPHLGNVEEGGDGAIGVSGSSVENDDIVAKAGVAVISVTDLPEHPWRT
jgi:hypothetical protein